jgi:hypothetical protein
MASENRFYRKDYPQYLKDELKERFTRHAKTSGYEPDGNEGPIGSTIEFKTFIWSDFDKDYTAPGATFKNGRLSTDAMNTDFLGTSRIAPRYEELLRITSVNIDIGGRVGSLSKAKISFELRGEDMFERFTKYVTQIGTKIELRIDQHWRGQATAIGSYQPDANKLEHIGRVYNYTFSYKGQYWWEGSIDTVGLAEMLTETNVLAILDPQGPGWPGGAAPAWARTIKVKDKDDVEKDIPCDNLLTILDMLWKTYLPNDTRVADIPKVTTLSVNPGKLFKTKGINLKDPFWGAPIPDTYTHYITLEGLRAVIQKIIDIAAVQSGNNIIKKLQIYYPPVDAKNKNVVKYPGSWTPYLISADPEKILVASKTETRYSNGEYYELKGVPNYKDNVNAKFGLLTNILISKATIAEAAGASQGSTMSLPAGGKSIAKFFENIFETIRIQTGGIIDLILLPEFEFTEDSAGSSLYIVDRNYKAPKAKTEDTYPIGFALYSHPQKHYIESDVWNLSGEVPKKLAAKAFVRDANLTAVDEQTSADGEESLKDDKKIDPKALTKELRKLAKGWSASETRSQDSTRMSEIMSTLFKQHVHDDTTKTKKELTKEALANKNIQTSLNLTMKSFGINGWKYGHALAISPIPSTAPGNTLFSINKITHDIKPSAKDTQYQWTTTLGLLARVVPESEKTDIKYYGKDEI